MEQRSYCKHHCFFCGKTISSNGAAKASHYRKHVREGVAEEVGQVHPDYRGQLDFVPLKLEEGVK